MPIGDLTLLCAKIMAAFLESFLALYFYVNFMHNCPCNCRTPDNCTPPVHGRALECVWFPTICMDTWPVAFQFSLFGTHTHSACINICMTCFCPLIRILDSIRFDSIWYSGKTQWEMPRKQLSLPQSRQTNCNKIFNRTEIIYIHILAHRADIKHTQIYMCVRKCFPHTPRANKSLGKVIWIFLSIKRSIFSTISSVKFLLILLSFIVVQFLRRKNKGLTEAEAEFMTPLKLHSARSVYDCSGTYMHICIYSKHLLNRTLRYSKVFLSLLDYIYYIKKVP